MITVRLKFNKTGLSAYYSQLDLQRVMARALKKSGLPVWYSLGFNPHIYMTFTLPLSLGHESYCESVDFRLNEEKSWEEIIAAMEGTLPEGIEITWAGVPDYDAKEIHWARYKITIFDSGETVEKAIVEYKNTDVVTVSKTTKKGTKDINLKELIKHIEILEKAPDSLTFTGLYPAGINTNINPALLLEYFNKQHNINIADAYILREHLFNENLDILQ